MKSCISFLIFLCLFSKCVCVLKRPNIVFILTDDQDCILGGLTPMQKTLSLIANEGATLENFFVNTPICCPSRSTILTGRYLHNHGVVNNSLSGNCSSLKFIKNVEPFTIATTLRKAGYNTFYAGKYLNQYGSKDVGGMQRVPKGWNVWHGLEGNSKYYNYSLSVNGVPKHFNNYYFTDYIKHVALNFLDDKTPKGTPFFMMLSPPAPHAPFTPAPRHIGKFANVTALRTPSFNYTPTSKHWIMQMKPLHLPENVDELDKIQAHRFETLLAVDEMVDSIVLKLTSLNILNDTYIIFTSDHGFHIGQFGQPWDKRQPYETDVRVPFLIRGPNVKKKRLISYPAQSVDIAPTVLEIAGIKKPSYMDGTSFLKQLINPKKKFGSKDILIEYAGEGNSVTIDSFCPYVGDNSLSECTRDNWCKCQDSRNNTYNCIRRVSSLSNFKFCEFFDEKATIEAYDLKNDPYELHNVHKDMLQKDIEGYRALIKKFQICKGLQCRLI